MTDGRSQVAELVANAEKRASQIVEDAKSHAAVEAARITHKPRRMWSRKLTARAKVCEQVAVLAVKGAEAILRSEVNAAKHADLLSNLKQELKLWLNLQPLPDPMKVLFDLADDKQQASLG